MKSKKSVFNIVSMAGYDGGISMVRWKSTYLQHGRGYPLIIYKDNFRSFPDIIDWVGLFHPLLPIGKIETKIRIGEKVTDLLRYRRRHTDIYITRARTPLMEVMDRREEFD